MGMVIEFEREFREGGLQAFVVKLSVNKTRKKDKKRSAAAREYRIVFLFSLSFQGVIMG